MEIKLKFSLLLFFITITFAFGQEVTLNDGYYLKEGKLFTGMYEQTNAESQIVSRLSIKKGILDGVCEFYENNALIEKRSYCKGQKHGAWTKYENGKLISSAFFVKDKKHGKWCIWDSDGTLRYEMYYKKGKKTGIWKIWDEKGTLISEKKY